MTAEFLRDDVLQHVEEIGSADILVGIPSYNNARTIGHVVRAVTAGLAKYFPDRTAVLVNSDGGSTDGTADVVAKAELGATRSILVQREARPVRKVITAYQGMPGKGSAFRTIFEIARRLDVRACAVVDSDLRSIAPEWIQLLVAPVLDEGFDYVCPLYARHKYDGTITNSIVYPLVRSVYGRRIRQPIGGDFGFSGRMAAHFLGHDVWESDVARFGIDIWMTTTALQTGWPVCQSYLGAKIHDAKDPSSDLTAMLVQVTGSLFQQLEAHAPGWFAGEGSEEVAAFGFEYAVGLEPVPVNTDRMVHAFTNGVHDLAGFYGSFLQPETLASLLDLAQRPPDPFHVPTDLWVRVVHQLAAAYHRRTAPQDHLLRSLTPLYLGRTASWVLESAPYGAAEVEEALDLLGRRFEALKPELIALWAKGGSTP
ncbi:MAG TPA: glycosyltransferase [Acidobacteriota bacterium]|nr:glycosyltransferase [Acidobacteriota bacterium]